MFIISRKVLNVCENILIKVFLNTAYFLYFDKKHIHIKSADKEVLIPHLAEIMIPENFTFQKESVSALFYDNTLDAKIDYSIDGTITINDKYTAMAKITNENKFSDIGKIDKLITELNINVINYSISELTSFKNEDFIFYGDNANMLNVAIIHKGITKSIGLNRVYVNSFKSSHSNVILFPQSYLSYINNKDIELLRKKYLDEKDMTTKYYTEFKYKNKVLKQVITFRYFPNTYTETIAKCYNNALISNNIKLNQDRAIFGIKDCDFLSALMFIKKHDYMDKVKLTLINNKIILKFKDDMEEKKKVYCLMNRYDNKEINKSYKLPTEIFTHIRFDNDEVKISIDENYIYHTNNNYSVLIQYKGEQSEKM